MTPVILTASAAILGLIPLAIGLNMDFETLFSHFDAKFYLGGDNVKFWGPLSWTMIFGLIVATFLTLLVVPTMYMLGYKTREWVKRKLSKVSA
jgi:multidrug efflux pump